MTKKSKLPPAKFREWAFSLLQIEKLADAACYTQPGSHEQSQLLRSLIRETRSLREKFVRQMEKPNAKE